jgi:FkbM family methyltransferase
MKQSFELDGMSLSVSKHHLTPQIIEAISAGRFEGAERRAIKMHLKPEGRVLDLGGGIGCTGVVAGRIIGGENLMILEANEDLQTDIEENLAANLIFGADVVHGAVVAKKTSETICFYKTKGFWASSVLEKAGLNATKVDVAAYELQEIISDFKPTVIVCDTEGIEIDLFKYRLPDHVRLIIMELHPNRYEQKAIKTLFDELSDMGFSYVPYGSHGAVACMGK